MHINSISSTPAFKGLLVVNTGSCGSGTTFAVNTKNIVGIEQSPGYVYCSMLVSSGQKTADIQVNHKLDDVLKAYNMASKGDDKVVRVDSPYKRYCSGIDEEQG